MRILLDTSILVRISHTDSDQFRPATEALKRLIEANVSICTVPQVFYEYWVVLTRPASQNGLGFSCDEVSQRLDQISAIYDLLPDNETLLDEWQRLVRQYQVLSKAAHDARLVAAMQIHQVTKLLTLNSRDFQRYPDIEVYTPDDLPESLDAWAQ